MKVRMYNVGCGDCFCLRDRKGSVLVDFGSSNNRIDGHPRSDIFDVIISDLTTISHKSLLLTNFHPDHISGLLYMQKKYKGSNEFHRIYLPDVFTSSAMEPVLTLLLLSDFMKSTSLPSHQISLYSFVELLLKQPQNVEFLKRGDLFEEKYQVLWPDQQILAQEGSVELETLQEIEGAKEGMDLLLAFAGKLRQIVCGEVQISAFALECELRKLREDPAVLELLERLEEKKINLRRQKNNISLVFHNASDGEMNVLFTGDIPQKYMRQIAENYDEMLPLHEHYWCIKVPHHGVEADFFDFSAYTPENMLISNGIYYADGKKQTKAYRTSAQYAGLFYIKDSHTYCSNSACCDGYRNGCTCKECDVIAPMYYKDI